MKPAKVPPVPHAQGEPCSTIRKPAAVANSLRPRALGLIAARAALLLAIPFPASAQDPVPLAPPHTLALRPAGVPLHPPPPPRPGAPRPPGAPPLIIEPHVGLPPHALPPGAPPPPPHALMAHLGACLAAGIDLMVDCLRDRLSSVEIRRLESCVRSETIPQDRPDDVRACVQALGLP